MKIIDNPCRDFVEELSSKAAVPGGGGAAALDGAMGSALLSMVCNLTLGKKKYAKYTERFTEVIEVAGKMKEEFLDMVDEDAENFVPLSKAYGLPENTIEEKEKKSVVLDECLKNACKVPLKVIRRSYDAILLHKSIINICSSLVLSDVGVGVQCLKSSAESAYLNVLINVKLIKDEEYVSCVKDEVEPLLDNIIKTASDVYGQVVSKLSE